MPRQKIYSSFHISGLIALKFKAELDEEEQYRLDTWLNESEANRQLFADINDSSIRQEDLQKLKSFNSSAALAIVMKRIAADKKVVKIKYRIAAAAAVLLILGAGLWFYTSRYPDAGQDPAVMLSLSKHDIAPGSNKATLTLANGQKINLSGAKTGVIIDATKLTYNDGTEVRDSALANGQPVLTSGQDHPKLNPEFSSGSGSRTITTPRGGTYQVILSDGTHIYLNATSSIKFPVTFAGLKERKVELTGEAYFIVKHNAKQPFKVLTKGQIVEDIGTEFNINSYADESTVTTTLVEGSARVFYTSRHSELVSEPRNRKATIPDNTVTLKPGQQSSLSHNGNIKVTQVDTEEVMAWQKGYFLFANEDIKSIMRKVARWYDVEVVYKGDVANKAIGGTVSRYKNVSEVLSMLTATKAVRFKIEGKKITVMPYK